MTVHLEATTNLGSLRELQFTTPPTRQEQPKLLRENVELHRLKTVGSSGTYLNSRTPPCVSMPLPNLGCMGCLYSSALSKSKVLGLVLPS